MATWWPIPNQAPVVSLRHHSPRFQALRCCYYPGYSLRSPSRVRKLPSPDESARNLIALATAQLHHLLRSVVQAGRISGRLECAQLPCGGWDPQSYLQYLDNQHLCILPVCWMILPKGGLVRAVSLAAGSARHAAVQGAGVALPLHLLLRSVALAIPPVFQDLILHVVLPCYERGLEFDAQWFPVAGSICGPLPKSSTGAASASSQRRWSEL
jgi:hypothetical protein